MPAGTKASLAIQEKAQKHQSEFFLRTGKKLKLSLAPNATDYLDNDGGHQGGDEEGVEAGEDVPVDDEDGGEVAEDAAGHEDAGHTAHEDPQCAGFDHHPTLKVNELVRSKQKRFPTQIHSFEIISRLSYIRN